MHLPFERCCWGCPPGTAPRSHASTPRAGAATRVCHCLCVHCAGLPVHPKRRRGLGQHHVVHQRHVRSHRTVPRDRRTAIASPPPAPHHVRHTPRHSGDDPDLIVAQDGRVGGGRGQCRGCVNDGGDSMAVKRVARDVEPGEALVGTAQDAAADERGRTLVDLVVGKVEGRQQRGLEGRGTGGRGGERGVRRGWGWVGARGKWGDRSTEKGSFVRRLLHG